MTHAKKGFTLIELLVVIAIIAILSAIGLVALNGAREKARDAQRRSDLAQIRTALALFYDDYNSYPGVSDSVGSGTVATTNILVDADMGNDSSGANAIGDVLTTGLSDNYLAQQLNAPTDSSYATRALATAAGADAEAAYDQSHYGYLAANSVVWDGTLPFAAPTQSSDAYILFVRLEAGGGDNMYGINEAGTVYDINSNARTAATIGDETLFLCTHAATTCTWDAS